MRLGESYIEGKALSDDGEYTINIQGGKTCLVLPSEFAEKCENATIHFFTEKGTEQTQLNIQSKLPQSKFYWCYQQQYQ